MDRLKEFAFALAMGIMGILAALFVCAGAEGIAIEGWIMWYLAGAALMSMLALAIGLANDE